MFSWLMYLLSALVCRAQCNLLSFRAFVMHVLKNSCYKSARCSREQWGHYVSQDVKSGQQQTNNSNNRGKCVCLWFYSFDYITHNSGVHFIYNSITWQTQSCQRQFTSQHLIRFNTEEKKEGNVK